MFSPVKTEPAALYTLNSVSEKKYKPPKQKPALLVSKMVARPGYQTSRMIYVDREYHLETFSKNQWVASPAQMFTPLITQSLRNTGFYHAVLESPFIGSTDLRLDTRLLQFQQEFYGLASKVSMVVQAHLIDSKNKVIASQRFATTVDTPHNDPYGGVLAANQASLEILHALTEFSVRHSRI